MKSTEILTTGDQTQAMMVCIEIVDAVIWLKKQKWVFWEQLRRNILWFISMRKALPIGVPMRKVVSEGDAVKMISSNHLTYYIPTGPINGNNDRKK